ncbi:MAG: DUF4876 domain-containing protein [Bacteroidales bacterium]
MITKLKLLSIASIVLLFFSCQDENSVTQTNTLLTISLEHGEDHAELSVDNYQVVWTNLSSNRSYEGLTQADGTLTLEVPQGIYSLSVEGKSEDVNSANFLNFQAATREVAISGAEMLHQCVLEHSVSGDGWLFREIYFSGSTTTNNKSYWQDQYFEIYNNSNEVLYADGLTVAESDYTNTSDNNIWSDLLPGTVAVGTLYSVPGNGNDYPVNPGSSIILASNGINHKVVNENSPVDLSKADFEWYDEHNLDTDVPEVPNLIKHFSYSATVWILHTRGYKAYILFHPGEEMSEFMNKNFVRSFTASGSETVRVGVPIKSVYDAVEISQPEGPASKALPAGLDKGFSYCNGANLGVCIKRRVVGEENGRVILQDTNNSSVDFEANATPDPLMK